MPAARNSLPRGTDLVDHLLSLPPERRLRWARLLGFEEAEAVDLDWPGWAHDGQRPPAKCPDGSDWRTWVIMAGRGFGKTRGGAEWVAERAREESKAEIALVAATLDEARRVMVEGRSGLLNVADGWIDDWHPTRRTLRFTNGARATLFSGASPDWLRGPEHHFAWCDELAKWDKPGETWDMLQLGLRVGEHPRAIVTTTPRAGPVLHRIMDEPGCVVTRGSTRQNPHISAAYKANVARLYEGTRLGRQELDGELLAEGGALWTVETLERCREGMMGERSKQIPFVSSPSSACQGRRSGQAKVETRGPGADSGFSTSRLCSRQASLETNGSGLAFDVLMRREGYPRTVIGVDPPSGDGTCGIIACAIDEDGIGHVLADHSVTARSPEGWARAVADAAAIHRAASVVAERNQGGKMVAAVLRAADPALPLKLVHASDGKAVRAQPVALLFEAGKVRLHGRFDALEAELLALVSGAPYQGPGASPDRADAMVWALTELMLGRAGEARVRGLI